LGACGGVLRSQEVPPGLGRGLGEEHSPIGENWRWGSEGVVGKEESRDDMEGFEDGPGESQEERTLSSTSC